MRLLRDIPLLVVCLVAFVPGCGDDDADGSSSSAGGADSSGAGDGDGDGDGDGEDPWLEVPAGTFVMGTDDAAQSEGPAHQVTVPAFAMLEHEVTVVEYRACVEDGGCTPPSGGSYPAVPEASYTDQTGEFEDHPVTFVSPQDADDYCKWLNARLPTEAEWEYAARGDDERTFPWGEQDASCQYASMMGTGGVGCGSGGTEPVGSHPSGAGPFGHLDLAGSVFEYTADSFHATYDGALTDGSAWTDGGTGNVCRGGWGSASSLELRTTFRWRCDEASPLRWAGIRCARSG